MAPGHSRPGMRIMGFPAPVTTAEKLRDWQTASCAVATNRSDRALNACFMPTKYPQPRKGDANREGGRHRAWLNHTQWPMLGRGGVSTQPSGAKAGGVFQDCCAEVSHKYRLARSHPAR